MTFKIEDNLESKKVSQPTFDSEPDPKIQLYIARTITELKDSQTANFITILGIFASFLAFLIIEIQILKAVCDYLRILGFSLFILGALFCFITFLIYFIDSQGKKITQMLILTFISIALIIGGIVSIIKGDDEYVCQLNNLDSNFEELKIDLRKNNESWLNDKEKELNSLELKVMKSLEK